MKYRAKKCIFDPCFMLYVPDLLLWKVHLACIPAISTGTPRKSLWKQIIQQLERNRIKNPNWHWRQPLKLLTIKAATKNKSSKWPQQDPNQGLLDCNLSDVVPYSASHFLMSMAFHNFCLRGGELYIQLKLHESLHNGHVSITAIFWRTVHTFTPANPAKCLTDISAHLTSCSPSPLLYLLLFLWFKMWCYKATRQWFL